MYQKYADLSNLSVGVTRLGGSDWFPGPGVEKAHTATTFAKWKFIFTHIYIQLKKSPQVSAPNIGDSPTQQLHPSTPCLWGRGRGRSIQEDGRQLITPTSDLY